MNIIQRLIPASNKDTRPGTKMNPKYITIHETDNPGAGADATAHARLQERGNDRSASWHLQIDDHQAIQSIPFNEIAWAAGDGGNGPGNTKSIHIEICVNADGDFKKAVQNTAEVTKQLMTQFNIPISNVVQHNKWTGKNCPRHLRAGDWGINWADFINFVKEDKKVNNGFTDRVIIPNTAFWQVKKLIPEYMDRGYKAYGQPILNYDTSNAKDSDPWKFVIETTAGFANQLVIEFKRLGYDQVYVEAI